MSLCYSVLSFSISEEKRRERERERGTAWVERNRKRRSSYNAENSRVLKMTKKPLKRFKMLGQKRIFVSICGAAHLTAPDKNGHIWPLCNTDMRRRGRTRRTQKFRYHGMKRAARPHLTTMA